MHVGRVGRQPLADVGAETAQTYLFADVQAFGQREQAGTLDTLTEDVKGVDVSLP